MGKLKHPVSLDRLRGFRGRRTAPELHACSAGAARDAVRDQPRDQGARGATREAALPSRAPRAPAHARRRGTVPRSRRSAHVARCGDASARRVGDFAGRHDDDGARVAMARTALAAFHASPPRRRRPDRREERQARSRARADGRRDPVRTTRRRRAGRRSVARRRHLPGVRSPRSFAMAPRPFASLPTSRTTFASISRRSATDGPGPSGMHGSTR